MRGGTLRFIPVSKRVELGDGILPPDADPPVAAITGVDGLASAFSLEVILKGNIVDVCVDGRRTMVARRDLSPINCLTLWTRDALVVFEDVQVRAL